MSTMTVTTKITHRYLMNKTKWDLATFTMQIVDMNDDLQKELDRIRVVNDKTYCAYCGADFPLDDDAASMVSEHIKTCEKHPMRKVEHLLSTTQDALDASNTHIRQLEREIMELRGTLP